MRIFLCLLLATFTVQAGSKPDSLNTGNNASLHTLPPEKLDAIRLISRNILLAKKKTEEEPSDKEQLMQLRSTLDKLIAVEATSLHTSVISPANKIVVAPSSQQSKDDTLRKAAQTQAWDIVSKLRQDGSQLQRLNKSAAKAEVYSAGFPIGEQHGRLYDELADKLETILSNNNSDRVAQLSALRDRLNIKKHITLSASLSPETPTAQAAPWKYPEASVPKMQRKNKSSH